jgi:hypothetical protein
MGDRGNIVVRGAGSQVFLYTHWEGYQIPEFARMAIATRRRWDDPQYLARIVFDTMAWGRQGDETGFGISSNLHDNGHPLLIVDCDKQQVFLESDERSECRKVGPEAKPLSFEEFASLSAADFGTFDPRFNSDEDEAAE